MFYTFQNNCSSRKQSKSKPHKMDADLTKFIGLLGVSINENTNLTPILSQHWSFTAYNAQHPENIYELNFIKWQLEEKVKANPILDTITSPKPYQSPINTQYVIPSPQRTNTPQASPQRPIVNSQPSSPAILGEKTDYHALPDKLKQLKKYVNNVEGTFSAFSLVKEKPNTPLPIIVDDNQQTENKTEEEPISIANELPDDYDLIEDLMTSPDKNTIAHVYTTPVKMVHRGKDVLAAKKQFAKEQEDEEELKKTKTRPQRKRKRECGRPTNDEQLIRLEEDFNDMAAMQLTRQKLTLPDSKGKPKKSRTILTKIQHEIVVNTGREFDSYELFTDEREECLKIIQEKRQKLQKINSAEYVLYSLTKKQDNSDSSS
ncbi:Hypothetical predicted protein [Paramuricea clavata]|uniref:Uncharacterized protein n=1 Tax=Paramuricea clavata TaxID=317549 RepID=A0A6S7FKE8_PARCT|nr:Hypothetical predicted protein [Paramuricea clavata]